MNDKLTPETVRDMIANNSRLQAARAIADDLGLDGAERSRVTRIILTVMEASEANGIKKATRRMADVMKELTAEAE